MRFSLPFRNCCKDSSHGTSRVKVLASTSSSNLSTSILAKLAAGALICASAGLGATYAWTSGEHYGPVLAALLVLFAVGLEVCKPISIAAAFDAFRSWRVVQGAALALLGLVAVTYSLTAELSLMATARGDLVAERTSQSDTRTKANDRYDRAKLELLTLPSARPKAELDAKIAGLLQIPGADGCKEVNGKVTREVCPQVSELQAEAARAERREQLEATMVEAERDTAKAPTERMADPGASALAAYLAIIGLAVDPKLLSNLLVLVGVVSLEAGSALALVMVRAVSPAPVNRPISEVKTEVVQPPFEAAVVQVVQPIATAHTADLETERQRVKDRIVEQLKLAGGTVSSGERGLAKKLGSTRSTLKRALQGLVVAGVVAAEISRNGTMLRLLA